MLHYLSALNGGFRLTYLFLSTERVAVGKEQAKYLQKTDDIFKVLL